MFRVHFLVFLVGRLVSVCALPHSCTPCFAFLPTALARRCISISNPFFPCLLSCFACIVQEQADFLAASDCKRQQANYSSEQSTLCRFSSDQLQARQAATTVESRSNQSPRCIDTLVNRES